MIREKVAVEAVKKQFELFNTLLCELLLLFFFLGGGGPQAGHLHSFISPSVGHIS